MQNRISILSTLLIIALVIGGASMCSSRAFMEGFKEGSEDGARAYQMDAYEKGYQTGSSVRENLHLRICNLHLVPNDYRVFTDTILNTKTGENVQMSLRDVRMNLPTENNPLNWVSYVLAIISILASLVFVILLLCFISAVKSGNFFEKSNELKLNLMGIIFILWYLTEWGIELIEYSFIKSAISLENYTVSLERISVFPLVIGIIFLLFAQIFAKGRKMKEDQEFMV